MKTCPKCSCTRATADAKVPDWQCPKCCIVIGNRVIQGFDEGAILAALKAL